MMRDYDQFYEASFEVNCRMHVRSQSLSGDCVRCLEVSARDADANSGPRGLCGDCIHAEFEGSTPRHTWCTAWKPAGFPVRPRVKRCARYKPSPPPGPDDYWQMEVGA